MRASRVLLLLALVSVACAYVLPHHALRSTKAEFQRRTRSVEGTCTHSSITYACVAQGGSCAVNYSSNSYPICYDGECNYVTETCPILPGAGAACNTSTGCASGLACNPVTNVCVRQSDTAGPGGNCSSNNDCFFIANNGTEIASCVNNQCLGLALGAACSVYYEGAQCSGTSFCSTAQVCTAPIAVGSACDGNATCVANAVCSNSVCTVIGSVANGGACSETAVCPDGSFCSPTSNTCKTAYFSGNCSLSTDCTDGAYCLCNTNNEQNCESPQGNPTGYVAVETALGSCIASNPNIADGYTLARTCSTQWCAYLQFIISVNTPSTGTNCLDLYYASIVSNFYPGCVASTTAPTTSAPATGTSAPNSAASTSTSTHGSSGATTSSAFAVAVSASLLAAPLLALVL